MKHKIIPGLMICGALLLCSACGGGKSQDPNKLGSKYDHVFQSANPEVKARWDAAMAALQTNGYAAATEALQSLLVQTNVSQEQIQAAHETVVAVSDSMYDAANKGDPAALQSIEQLRNATGR